MKVTDYFRQEGWLDLQQTYTQHTRDTQTTQAEIWPRPQHRSPPTVVIVLLSGSLEQVQDKQFYHHYVLLKQLL